MNTFKRSVKSFFSLIPLRCVEYYLLWKFGYQTLSFSLNGEDIVLQNLFQKTKNGFYVDVGAYHPTVFSNTYLFYRKGWHGINIDATPGKIELFHKHRPGDINIEIAVSNTKRQLEFFLFDKSALNTSVVSVAKEQEEAGYPIRERLAIPAKKLGEILKEHLPNGKTIDFLNIDVEGLDLEVLESNDWGMYLPRSISVEDRKFNSEEPLHSPIFSFLEERGYRLVAYMGTTLIFTLVGDTKLL